VASKLTAAQFEAVVRGLARANNLELTPTTNGWMASYGWHSAEESTLDDALRAAATAAGIEVPADDGLVAVPRALHELLMHACYVDDRSPPLSLADALDEIAECEPAAWQDWLRETAKALRAALGEP
jgi:cell wall assembly regulator SMI1